MAMKMTRTIGEYMQLYYRASIDSQLLFLKTIMILNSGALVSILVALSRADADDFSKVVIGSAYYFWGGLFAAIVSAITFVPVETDISCLEAGQSFRLSTHFWQSRFLQTAELSSAIPFHRCGSGIKRPRPSSISLSGNPG